MRGFGDPIAMMVQRPVREMRERCLAGIEPIVKRLKVLGAP
jgi:hypothetical protein